MQINYVITTPTNQRILANSISERPGKCQGVMAWDMQEGMYPPLHTITYPADSIVEHVVRHIQVKGEQLQRLAGAQSSAN